MKRKAILAVFVGWFVCMAPLGGKLVAAGEPETIKLGAFSSSCRC